MIYKTDSKGPTFFIEHPYDGTRSKYKIYKTEVLSSIRIDSPPGYEFMTTNWELDDKFEELEVPAPLTTGPIAEKVYRRDIIRDAKEHNEKLQHMFSVIRNAITLRLIPTFREQVDAIDDPYLLYHYWKEFEQEHGEGTGGELDIGEDHLRKIFKKMEPDGHFSAYIKEMEANWKEAKFPDNLRMALITSVGQLPFGLKLLPPRLDTAINQARIACQAFAESKKYIKLQDELYHNKANDTTTTIKSKKQYQGKNRNCQSCTRFRKIIKKPNFQTIRISSM